MTDDPVDIAMTTHIRNALLIVLALATWVALGSRLSGPHVDIDARHDALCQSWGAAYHTPEYAICRAALEAGAASYEAVQ